MTLHRTFRPIRRRLAAGSLAVGLAFTGLAATTTSPAHAALPSQCVTSGSVVTCTLSRPTSSSSMTLQIPSDVTSIQVHAVGERGGGSRGPGQVGANGGKPAVIDASVPVQPGEVVTARLLEDGGAAGTSVEGKPEAGAGGSSVTVARASGVIVQAAGGGGAGAFLPVLNGDQYPYSGGGYADQMGFWAARNDPSGHPAGGGMPGSLQSSEAGWGGSGARLYACPGYAGLPNGSNGTGLSGGSGADGEYGGGGGGGGSLGGGGGGAGGTGCEGYSYGAGGGGGGSIIPGGAGYSYSTTESYLVRISFWVGPRSSHSPSVMSFGKVAVGSTSPSQTLTVSNTGSIPLTLGSGVFGGSKPSSFRKTNDSCSNATVAPGATCQVGLQFLPLTSGTMSATFTLPDDSLTSPHVVTLSGTGAAESSHAPGAMSFGEVAVGSVSAVQTLTVTNTGSASLQVGSGVFTGPNASKFAKLTDTCSNRTVAPAASCRVDVVFAPSVVGDQSATFTLSDDSLASPHVVALSGTGTRPVAVTSVSSLAFGAQEVGKAGAVQTVTLTNQGTGPLSVSHTTFTGVNQGDFSTTYNSCTGASVAPNSSCSVSVRMTASDVGYRLGVLKFVHDAAQRSSEVGLHGNGTPPADLTIRGVGSVFTGRDHLVTRTVAGPGKLMTYPLTILNEDSVPRTYRIAITSSGSSANAELWTTGFSVKMLPQDQDGLYTTAVIQPKKTLALSLRVTPTAPGQTTSGVVAALYSDNLGLIEQVRTETNTAAPLNGISSFELFSKQGSQLFVGGPVSGQTSTGQALTVGNAAAFTLRLKNDGSSSQRIGLRLSDVDGCAGSFAVTVTAAGKVVTTPAFNGTYLTPLLAPTKFQDVLVTIKRVAGGCPSKAIRAQSLNNGVVVRTSYLLANAAYNASTD